MRKRIYILLLTVGVLAGAPWAITHAVFGDSTTVSSNEFTTGTVDISLSPASALFTVSNMAPGDSTTASLAVSNLGSLDLRYAISASATNSDAKGLKDQLSLTIKTAGTSCSAFDGAELYTGDLDGTAGKLVGDGAQGFNAGDRTLAASGSETLCFRVSLPLSSGNSYQNATTTATFTFDAEQTRNN